jgi:predicted HTH transcriptional regulator
LLRTIQRGDKPKSHFAEDVASLANTSGGVLVIGVNDKRGIVGIGEGRNLEKRDTIYLVMVISKRVPLWE